MTEDCVFQLNPRELNVDEQATCAAAKRRELQSCIENSIWQFCDEKQASS